jgi:hypothetical protein
MKLIKLLLLEQEENKPVDILFDDAAVRVISFSTTHTIENPEVLSTNVLREIERIRIKKDFDLIHKGYVGYGWGPMWKILQDVKASRINNINAIFIDSDIKYEDIDKEGKTEKYPGWEFTDKQKLDFYDVKHGMTGGDTLDRISRVYKQEASNEGLGINDRDFYLPYGIGLVDYLCDHKDVGNKIEHIVVGNSSASAASYFVDRLKRVYGGKVKRILPGALKSTGYII